MLVTYQFTLIWPHSNIELYLRKIFDFLSWVTEYEYSGLLEVRKGLWEVVADISKNRSISVSKIIEV